MSRRVLQTDRRITPPTGIGRTTGHKKAGDQNRSKDRNQPERHRIQPRERHVRRADHGGDQQVIEAIENRKDEQEQHDCSVHRVDAVVDRAINEIRRRRNQLPADHHGQEATDQEEKEGRDDVLNANDLGIGAEAEVALPAALRWRFRGKGGDGHRLRAQASWGCLGSPGTFT